MAYYPQPRNEEGIFNPSNFPTNNPLSNLGQFALLYPNAQGAITFSEKVNGSLNVLKLGALGIEYNGASQSWSNIQTKIQAVGALSSASNASTLNVNNSIQIQDGETTALPKTTLVLTSANQTNNIILNGGGCFEKATMGINTYGKMAWCANIDTTLIGTELPDKIGNGSLTNTRIDWIPYSQAFQYYPFGPPAINPSIIQNGLASKYFTQPALLDCQSNGYEFIGVNTGTYDISNNTVNFLINPVDSNPFYDSLNLSLFWGNAVHLDTLINLPPDTFGNEYPAIVLTSFNSKMIYNDGDYDTPFIYPYIPSLNTTLTSTGAYYSSFVISGSNALINAVEVPRDPPIRYKPDKLSYNFLFITDKNNNLIGKKTVEALDADRVILFNNPLEFFKPTIFFSVDDPTSFIGIKCDYVIEDIRLDGSIGYLGFKYSVSTDNATGVKFNWCALPSSVILPL